MPKTVYLYKITKNNGKPPLFFTSSIPTVEEYIAFQKNSPKKSIRDDYTNSVISVEQIFSGPRSMVKEYRDEKRQQNYIPRSTILDFYSPELKELIGIVEGFKQVGVKAKYGDLFGRMRKLRNEMIDKETLLHFQHNS